MAYENQNPWLQLYPNALNIFGVPSLQQTPQHSSQNYYDRMSRKEKEKLQDRWKAFNDTDLQGAIAPTFNWANKKALFTVGKNQYNAKTMPLISEGNQIYGIGLANYDWTPENIHNRVNTIRANKDEKAGGQKQLWNYWNKWIDNRTSADWTKERKKALKTYLTSGNAKGVRMDDILMMSDAGLRETARHQQHKGNFISRTWDAITSPENWMNAALAYGTGNPQWTHRTIQGVTDDMRGSPDGPQDQYGTVEQSQDFNPYQSAAMQVAMQGLGESSSILPIPGSGSSGQLDTYQPGDLTQSEEQEPEEEEDQIAVEMNPYVTRQRLQAIIQRGQQEEEERKRLMHRLGEYSPTFAKRGLIQPVQPIRSRLLG